MIRRQAVQWYRPVSRRFLSAGNCSAGPLYQQYKITKLEDLNKIENIEDVDPQLLRKLIEERTDSLNSQNELKMLKELSTEQNMIRKNTLRPFIRPAWVLFLMSSTVYMGWQFYWWYSEYSRKEVELQREVGSLEAELNTLLNKKSQPWYRRLF
ncbi:inner membrane assembly complex subunit 17 [Monosporozyma servazzii]